MQIQWFGVSEREGDTICGVLVERVKGELILTYYEEDPKDREDGEAWDMELDSEEWKERILNSCLHSEWSKIIVKMVELWIEEEKKQLL